MDLARAKSVIIALLVAFNLFLLFNNLIYFRGQGVQKETIKNTEVILKARGVTLECPIPSASKGTHRLKYGNGKLDRSAIALNLLGGLNRANDDWNGFEYAGKKLVFSSDTEFVFTDDNPASEIDVGAEAVVKKAAQEYLKNKGLLNGRYVVDELKRGQNGSVVVSFIEVYDGFLIYDNYSKITLNSKGVAQLEYRKLQIIGFSAGKVEDLAAAYQVLLAHFKEGSEQVITRIDNGYKYTDEYSIDGMESAELLPVWRIKIKADPVPLYLGALDDEKGSVVDSSDDQ